MRVGIGRGDLRHQRRSGRRPLWPSFIALTVLTAVSLGLIAQGRSEGAVLVVRSGTVRVLAADTVENGGHDHTFKGRSEDVYRAVLVGDDGHLYFLSGPRKFPSNKRIRVSGTLSGTKLDAVSVALEPRPAPKGLASTAYPPAEPSASGTTNVLVMLAYWNAPDSVTPASAAAQMFGDTNAWYRDSSYGALGQTGAVTPWMRVDPPTANQCYADSDRTMSQAKASATALGYDLAAYNNFVVYFPYDGDPGSDCAGYAGWAFVGAQGTWLNGYLDRRVTVHEQGHNYGLLHAHSLLCSGRIDASCEFSDYGNDYDAMGSSNYVGHFSASQKSKLGWMDGRVQDLTHGGSTTLSPFESDAVSTQAAVVNVSADRSYWLEYRQPTDFDRDLPSSGTDGVMLTMKGEPPSGDGAASILDSRPGDGLGVGSATIRPGESWRSDEGAVISVSSISPGGAVVSVIPPVMGTLTGVVRDARGAALSGALVQVDDASTATTDTAGRYTLPFLAEGSHTVAAKHVCLGDERRSVDTVAGNQTADFTLPTPTNPPCVMDAPSWDEPTDLLPLTGDDEATSVAIPFSYSHYGQRYSTAYVSTNGTLNFLAPSPEYENSGLPNTGTPNATVAAFWDDLIVDAGARVLTGTFGSPGDRRFVVEWRDAALLADPSRRVTVQAVLYEDASKAVRLQYRGIDQASIASGSSATVGIENAGGDEAQQVSYNSGVLYDGLAIRLPVRSAPSVSVGDAAIPEGSRDHRRAVVTVSMSHAVVSDVRVPFHTASRSATAGVDYVEKSGTVIIPTGRTSATVAISVSGDRTVEPRESFGVVLGDPVGAVLNRSMATVRILNDDPERAQHVGIGDASVVEGNDGNRLLRFSVVRSAASTSRTTVAYGTLAGTAGEGTDFSAAHGVLTIPAGATSATVSVRIRPDTNAEGTESFTVRLTDAHGAALGRTIGTGRVIDDD